MGFFGDIKGSIEAAQAMTPEDAVVAPAQRLDTIVIDPAGGAQLHRSDYAGEIWFGGRPTFSGINALPGQTSEIDSTLPLPDSLVYAGGTDGSVQIQTTAALLSARATSAGGAGQILETVGTLEPDPDGGGTLLTTVRIAAVALLPVGISYRLTVICSPEAVTTGAP